ncbi:peptide-methionine (S)-S-oxide reductase [Roseivirga pacifica]|uniref:Peptide methionine sulfoxide reductase MsrA n=1 Tax=Roseivirga pacifica TaxID=1267423 RepID=A0A1I0QFR7_9BACT|nr:peptide-methionine (S)-S-oxide reductase MsrA [Roseivirga pacifica]RKQ42965.1 peptide-methionine (S)-S-oxide reductase [Roseivirga pacifica]SEW25862.1 peptide-methionine (S)-S-oxide reductase [Roseivirga pacifica]
MSLLSTFLTTVLLNLSMTACGPGDKTEAVSVANLEQEGREVATFAGGCFWCTEAVFERVEGVIDVYSGYTGGDQENPTYKQVSYGETNHAEAVQIVFDPSVIKYQELLNIFFATIDPTQLNRQGPDVGAQYRNVVFYHSFKQQIEAEATVNKLNRSGKYEKELATTVEKFTKFWKAEGYHQDYYELNPGNPYIINIAVPKVKKLKMLFPDKIKPKYQSEN